MKKVVSQTHGIERGYPVSYQVEMQGGDVWDWSLKISVMLAKLFSHLLQIAGSSSAD